MASLSEKPEKSYECDQCDYKTSRADHFKNHTLCHSGEKAFKCDQCASEFVLSNSLETHLRKLHGIFEVLQCKFCNLTFEFRSELAKHEQVHRGRKLIGCSECSKTYLSTEGLKRHVNSEHLKKSTKCDQCDQEFLAPQVL